MKKYWYILLVIGSIAAVVLFFNSLFNIGRYPGAEYYEVNCKDTELIMAVQHFQHDNPQYSVPLETGLRNGMKEEYAQWYDFYFYFKEQDKIVHAAISADDVNTCLFALVSTNNTLTVTNWKDINDLPEEELKVVKTQFEIRILNPAKKYIGVPHVSY